MDVIDHLLVTHSEFKKLLSLHPEKIVVLSPVLQELENSIAQLVKKEVENPTFDS